MHRLLKRLENRYLKTLNKAFILLLFSFALQENNALVSELIKNEKFDEVYDFIKTSDALEKTKALAKSYTLSALNLIDKLPKGKNRELIAEITRKLLERTL